jgi:hypothetical protein
MLIIVRFRILVLMCKWYMVEEVGDANSEIVFRLLETGYVLGAGARARIWGNQNRDQD